MSDFEHQYQSSRPVVSGVVDGLAPAVQARTPASLCGRTAGAVEPLPANENAPTAEGLLFNQLPKVIRDAVDEWADHLRATPWQRRRQEMTRFAEVFADQFQATIPDLDDEAYEGLKEIGYTCLLERLDDGRPIACLHQARVYLDSVHDNHQLAAKTFLGTSSPREISIH